jgi:hypothetical protein
MIEITFPDGASRSFESNSTPFDIARSISEGLAMLFLPNSIITQLKHQQN